MEKGPTVGAAERDARAWHASPTIAISIRLAAFLIPLIVSVLFVRAVSNALYRPQGWQGLVIWFVQAAVIGITVSMLVDRVTRRLLPLAALFSMSLVFPDEAPTRFSVALRSGATSRLRASADRVKPIDASIDPNEAAGEALHLVAALARHDRLTRGHTERVRAYADMIGEEMGLDPEARIRLSWAGLLHDVGKLAVPAQILNKNGRPDPDEWETLSHHPTAAIEFLGPLGDWLGDWVLAASEHHERWDGNGYPKGLAGTEISLAGRIVAVADAYDVITSKRSYKEAMSADSARRELVKCSGTQFDPEVVRAFLNVSLGRRWLAGPFASLVDLPLGSVGGAVGPLPAVAAVSALALTATTVVPASADDAIAFAEPVATTAAPAPEIEETTTVVPEVTVTTERSAVTATVSDAPPTTTTITTVGPTTTQPSTSRPTTSRPTTSRPTTSPPTTTPSTSTNPTTTATPTTAAPTTTTTTTTTTQPPTTVSRPTIPTTTTTSPAAMGAPPAPPEPPTTAPTTTTTTLPTTTAAPTTTTTTIPPNIYFLKNDGTGDTRFQFFNALATDAPDNATLPNYDTDYDSVPGQRLLASSRGLGETDTKKIQTYAMDPNGGQLNGSTTATLWASTVNDTGGSPVALRAILRDCNAFLTGCTIIAEDTQNVSSTSMQSVTFDFGTTDYSFGDSRRLVLILLTEGSESLNIGFDADTTPSSMSLPL